MTGINGLPPTDAVQPVPRIDKLGDKTTPPDFQQEPVEAAPVAEPPTVQHTELLTAKEPGTYGPTGRKTPPPPGTRLDVRSR